MNSRMTKPNLKLNIANIRRRMTMKQKTNELSTQNRSYRGRRLKSIRHLTRSINNASNKDVIYTFNFSQLLLLNFVYIVLFIPSFNLTFKGSNNNEAARSNTHVTEPG